MSPVGPAQVETPIGYLDLGRVRANAAKVAAYSSAHGLRWRPHIKTHKSRAIARIQLEAGACGLTVATAREAEVMASLSDDLLVAYPPVGRQRLERLLALPPEVDVKVALDTSEALGPLARAAHAAGRRIGVLVEQDVGLGRVGLPGAEDVTALAARAAEAEGVDFRGILFYPGHIRMGEAEQSSHLHRVSAALSATLEVLAREELVPEIVSGGSTPTLWRSHEVYGLTEIRSGSCIFYDREALDIGVASPEDLAYTVLATVVSDAVPGRAVVDAGSKALSKEARGGEGFGFVFEHPEVRVASLSEEHGVLELGRSDWVPAVGDRVRIVPNHVCVSVNLQDRLLARDGDAHEFVELEARGRGRWRRRRGEG